MDRKNFDKLGIMIDCSRNAVMKSEMVEKWILLMEQMHYNTLMLYTEDTYEVENYPLFGHFRGRYSKEELRHLASFSEEHNIELIPCIQTLAHLNTLLKWPCFQPLFDCHDILMIDNDEVYKLVDSMFKTISECFITKTVHIGMDEAEFVGLGNYLKVHGYTGNRTKLLLSHLTKIAELAKKYGFQLLIWGDMFYKLAEGPNSEPTRKKINAELKQLIPDNVKLVYWDYYSTDESHYDDYFAAYSKMQDDIWFAGGSWIWGSFNPRVSFSEKATKAAIASCRRNGIRNYITTLWGDDGGECSRLSALPQLFQLSQYADGIMDMEIIKKEFYNWIGIEYDAFKLLELPNTPSCDGKKYEDCHLFEFKEKKILYNDFFLGTIDDSINQTDGLQYKECADKLAAFCANPEYGYLFKSMKCLCEVLELKANIGVDTRKAYKSGDLKKLQGLLLVYDAIYDRVEEFYYAFEKQWMLENKPHGFDVVDIRIGGLLRRLTHCKSRIEKYLAKELDCIEELEEPIIASDYGCDENIVLSSYWASVVTCNALGMNDFGN